MLVEALNEHQVIFTDKPIVPPKESKGHTLLALNWLDSHKPDGVKSLNRIELLSISAAKTIWGQSARLSSRSDV